MVTQSSPPHQKLANSDQPVCKCRPLQRHGIFRCKRMESNANKCEKLLRKSEIYVCSNDRTCELGDSDVVLALKHLRFFSLPACWLTYFFIYYCYTFKCSVFCGQRWLLIFPCVVSDKSWKTCLKFAWVTLQNNCVFDSFEKVSQSPRERRNLHACRGSTHSQSTGVIDSFAARLLLRERAVELSWNRKPVLLPLPQR